MTVFSQHERVQPWWDGRKGSRTSYQCLVHAVWAHTEQLTGRGASQLEQLNRFATHVHFSPLAMWGSRTVLASAR